MQRYPLFSEVMQNWYTLITGQERTSFLRKDFLFRWCHIKGKMCRICSTILWILRVGIFKFFKWLSSLHKKAYYPAELLAFSHNFPACCTCFGYPTSGYCAHKWEKMNKLGNKLRGLFSFRLPQMLYKTVNVNCESTCEEQITCSSVTSRHLRQHRICRAK